MTRLPLLLTAVLALGLIGCDSSGGTAAIGGTYTGNATNGPFSLTIPVGTESDSDATFNLTGVDVSVGFAGTGTYDHPALDVEIQIVGQNPQFTCTVEDGGDAMRCPLATGTVTITR